MSTTNYPSATPQSQPPKKDFKNLVIGLLAAGFLEPGVICYGTITTRTGTAKSTNSDR